MQAVIESAKHCSHYQVITKAITRADRSIKHKMANNICGCLGIEEPRLTKDYNLQQKRPCKLWQTQKEPTKNKKDVTKAPLSQKQTGQTKIKNHSQDQNHGQHYLGENKNKGHRIRHRDFPGTHRIPNNE